MAGARLVPELFGLDVSPDGARFATAGGDHRVKVWSLAPVVDAASEAGGGPRLLATLCDHFGPVNALRFSHSGSRLATGSDDKLVLVHERRPGPPRAVFGAADGPAVENWAVALSLRGHANNVTDVAWSRDDALLASASLDNLVYVWDATGARVAALSGARAPARPPHPGCCGSSRRRRRRSRVLKRSAAAAFPPPPRPPPQRTRRS